MIYNVTGNLHLWGWTDFKEEIKGRIVEYQNKGNVIISITYEVDEPIDPKILKKYKLKAKEVQVKNG